MLHKLVCLDFLWQRLKSRHSYIGNFIYWLLTDISKWTSVRSDYYMVTLLLCTQTRSIWWPDVTSRWSSIKHVDHDREKNQYMGHKRNINLKKERKHRLSVIQLCVYLRLYLKRSMHGFSKVLNIGSVHV